MKKIILIIISILVSYSLFNDLALANLDNNEVLNKKIYKIKKDIWKNGESYKTKVVNRLIKYSLQYIKDSQKLEIINYVISQIKDLQINYGRVISPAPILNTGSFSDAFYGSGYGPTLDDYEQIDPVESILFKGTAITIEETIIDNGNEIYKIQLEELPFYGDFFVDARFVKKYGVKQVERKIVLPTKDEILNNLKKQVGYDYIWGGVIPGGIKALEKLYKPKIELDEITKNRLILNGFDCSGLLYYVTNGFTPRNTSQLIYFGTGITIAGLTANEIIAKLEPLDLITWKGHVMIVLDKENLIESRVDYEPDTPGFQGGVRIRSIKPILEDLVANKIGVNDYDTEVAEGKKKFVVRRWFEENKN